MCIMTLAPIIRMKMKGQKRTEIAILCNVLRADATVPLEIISILDSDTEFERNGIFISDLK